VAPQTWKSLSQESYTAKETGQGDSIAYCHALSLYYLISDKNGIHSRIYRSQI